MRFLKSLIAGLVAGTALGVVFAPKKGKDFRKSLKKEVGEGGTGLETLKATVLEIGKEIQESCDGLSKHEKFKKAEKELMKRTKVARKKAKELVKEYLPEEAQEKIKEGLKEAKKGVSKAKKEATKAVKKAKKKIPKK